MRLAEPERGPVCVCALILAVTAAFKVGSLATGAALLAREHPFLPGTYRLYVWLGLAAEMGAFATLAWGGRRFLLACFGLSIVFLGYHTLGSFLRVPAPCPCLGGLLGHWKPLAEAEAPLSFLLACGLLAASFVGLFGVPGSAPAGAEDKPLRFSTAWISAGIWLLLGTAVVVFWHGRFLGGDEGMEAAKSMQILRGDATRMWNDQPPLWSMVGAGLFRLFGPSISWGRLLVVVIGALMPLTWAAYSSSQSPAWTTSISTVLLWLSQYTYLGSYMLEVPAYAIGLASLLPLVLAGEGWLPLFISAMIAAAGLSIKLTAAFALVVPFAWLCQRSVKRAFAWGLAAVGLLILVSLFEPGWSWDTMLATHANFGAEQALQHRFDAAVYADAWLVCLFALFAIANRYVKGRLQALAPWLWAAGSALLIHLVHRPFWSYYDVHLLAPLAVVAGVGAVDLWRALRAVSISRRQRGLALGAAAAICLCWIWQQAGAMAYQWRVSTDFAFSPITKELRRLGRAGRTAFAMQPLWTFAAGLVQTPPELTILPLKRFWCGQIDDRAIADLLRSNHVDALVLDDPVISQPGWTNLLTHYAPVAHDAESLLFERRELHPKPIVLRNDVRDTFLDHLGF